MKKQFSLLVMLKRSSFDISQKKQLEYVEVSK